MLHNPKWEKNDPLTLQAVIDWLEAQRPEKTYVYWDVNNCLAAQYNAAIGRKYPRPLSEIFDIQLEAIALQGARTFGEALKRAKKLKKTLKDKQSLTT